jgi:7,8-dihydropterin-6-yl-methyl-4-(beta-D-ribofuranosyl)aminobenzene 5'-phosphate synthase
VDEVVVTTLVDNVYDALLGGQETITRAPFAPWVWSRRRFALPGGSPEEWPTLSKRALTSEGFDVIERRQPSLLLNGSVLITGEVDRTTDFERGMPPAHQCWSNSTWEPAPLVLDDQALVVHVRGKGLLVVTGCGHAGAVNIVRHAQRLTAVPRLHALLGGLHLSGGYFAPSIAPTVEALTAMAPDLLVPGHCTGWQAQHTFPAALPDSWVQGSSGTRYRLSAVRDHDITARASALAQRPAGHDHAQR